MYATEAGLALVGLGKYNFLVFNTRGRFWLFVSTVWPTIAIAVYFISSSNPLTGFQNNKKHF